MCLWELQDNTGSSPILIRFTYQRWPLKCVKTLKTMVVYEDIHIEDYDMRRHWVKTMEREDCVISVFPFSSLLGHRNHHTIKWGRSEQSQNDWSDAQPKSYVFFELRQWEQILSRTGWVSFAYSPTKVAVCVWNLTIGTRVSSLVTQGHFGQIRSGCRVAINSPPPTTINGRLLRVSVRLLSFESKPPRSLWERIPCEDKALNTQSQRVLGIT